MLHRESWPGPPPEEKVKVWNVAPFPPRTKVAPGPMGPIGPTGPPCIQGRLTVEQTRASAWKASTEEGCKDVLHGTSGSLGHSENGESKE